MPRMHPLEERWSSLFTFALEVQVHFLYAVQIPPDTGREAEGRVTRQSPVASPASPLSLSLRFQLHPVEFGAPLKSLKPFGPVKRIQKELHEETQWLTFCNLDLCWSYVSKIHQDDHFKPGQPFPLGLFFNIFLASKSSIWLPSTKACDDHPTTTTPTTAIPRIGSNQPGPKKHEVQTSVIHPGNLT